ncbi:MAG TPA: tyrosine-protein phosphatase [Acidimicrobiales bacterium]
MSSEGAGVGAGAGVGVGAGAGAGAGFGVGVGGFDEVGADRLIALEGAVNFRDLGGYVTGDGLRTKWRVLFRADGLGDLTASDLTVLRALGIRTVVDLRSFDEVERSRFDVEAHPVDFHHYPFIKTLPDVATWEQAPGLLAEQYKEMADDAGDQIVRVLAVLAGAEARPAVFHCTAGKDRTGLLSAVLLLALGVDEETVVADYALSGAAMDRLRAKLMAKYPDGKDAIARLDEPFNADPAHMVGLLEHLHRVYGSIEAYLSHIGLDASLRDALRSALLEPAGIG